MKKIILFCWCILSLTSLIAQDSIFATNIYRHRISNGKKSSEKKILEQKTYNSDHQLVLKLQYSDTAMAIASFTRYYYQDKNLMSEESFKTNGEVLEIIRMQYDDSGNMKRKTYYTPGSEKMQQKQVIIMDWEGDRLIKKTGLNAKGKKAFVRVYDYAPDKTTESAKYKKGADEEDTKLLEVVKYYSEGDLVKKEKRKTSYSKNTELVTITFSYEDGKLKSKVWLNEQGQTVKRYAYFYFKDGSLYNRQTFDADDNLVEYISHEYIEHVTTMGDKPMFDLSKPIHQQSE